MSPVLDILLLVFCTVPTLAGPVRRNAELPTAPAGVRPSAFSIEPSESALLASIYAAASTAVSIDTCTEMPTTTDKISSIIEQSTSFTRSLTTDTLPTTTLLSNLAHYAAESSTMASETLFSYAPQAPKTTTASVASQPTSHTTGRRTTTLTEFTTVAAGYEQQTGSASVPSSTEDAASTTSITFSTTSDQSVPSYPSNAVTDQSSSAVLAFSSTTSLSAYTSVPAPYAVPANSSVAIAPSQYLSTFSSIAITSSESSVPSSVDVSATQVTSTASQYGGSDSASTTSQSSQIVVLSSSTSTNSAPLVYGSITLTYSTPSETSVSINPTQYVSTYPTASAEESTSHHRHHHAFTESASAPMAESSSAFGYPGPASSSAIAPSLLGYGAPLPTASDSSRQSVPSTSVLAIIPINPSSYPSLHGAEDVDSSLAAQHMYGQPEAQTAPSASGSAPPSGVDTHPVNAEFATMYITVTATGAGPTMTDFVTVSAY